jgi:hypothetical protein
MDIPAELVAVVSLVAGSIVWLIRLEGRVNRELSLFQSASAS